MPGVPGEGGVAYELRNAERGGICTGDGGDKRLGSIPSEPGDLSPNLGIWAEEAFLFKPNTKFGRWQNL